jgi:hypothetical protein
MSADCPKMPFSTGENVPNSSVVLHHREPIGLRNGCNQAMEKALIA